jgi:hypothetical protein
MRAGCVVLASEVGAFPEIIRSEYDGFLLKGKTSEESTLQEASEIILDLAKNEDNRKRISLNAAVSPLTWRIIAKAWAEHWDWVMNEKSPTGSVLEGCTACKSDVLALSDGRHCLGCGRYSKNINR